MTTPLANLMKRRFLATLEGLEWGRLQVTTPEGDRYSFGPGAIEADIEIRDWSMVSALLARGDIGLGEAYVGGLWQTSSIEALVTVALRNFSRIERYASPGPLSRLRLRLLDRVLRPNSLRGSSRNIRAHYDVGNEFYQLWLDPGMTYSSALFGDGDDLERAQARKYDRILSRLSDGERVLEIGCGWGGFAERAADQGRRVTGITLSPSQKGYADARLDGRASIELRDYRAVQGRYDNIVSIEMIEAVGERYWPAYFRTLRDHLVEGGRAVIQAITISDADFALYRSGSDYIRRHVFPGGMLPCSGALAQQADRAGLSIQDSFSFGQHYARTCRTWAERLRLQEARIRGLGYSQPFLKSWMFYLESCAAAFTVGRTDVLQVEFVRSS